MQNINYTLADLQALSPTITERFWQFVNKNGRAPEHCPEIGPCWIWTGCKNDKGYGQLFVTKKAPHKRLIYAHRLAWIIHHGPIPEELMVLHKCDNPLCTNAPDHMFLGDVLVNGQDRAMKGRSAQIKYGYQIIEAIRSHPELSCRALALAHGLSASQVWNIRTFKHRPAGQSIIRQG